MDRQDAVRPLQALVQVREERRRAAFGEDPGAVHQVRLEHRPGPGPPERGEAVLPVLRQRVGDPGEEFRRVAREALGQQRRQRLLVRQVGGAQLHRQPLGRQGADHRQLGVEVGLRGGRTGRQEVRHVPVAAHQGEQQRRARQPFEGGAEHLGPGCLHGVTAGVGPQPQAERGLLERGEGEGGVGQRLGAEPEPVHFPHQRADDSAIP
ncbi:hypothetical protein GCM10020229_67930 [Kitasatospora albolonga]|uniref:hypothetical protein n=1 Tax=Kitasatospora albolonga TaxID=68173 RepID=UPI00338C304B